MKSFESSEWKIATRGSSYKFVIVYRRPYSEIHPVPSSVFFEEFAAYIENIVLCPEILIIAGDFNFHMDNLSNTDASHFNDLLLSFGLSQHVNFATHISGHWLDLIITRSLNDVLALSPKPTLFLSDHCIVECDLAIPSSASTMKDVWNGKTLI